MKKLIEKYKLWRWLRKNGYYEPIRYRLSLWFGKIVCKLKGQHKLESDDWATPDSGYMGVHCERCGWSSGSYLY